MATKDIKSQINVGIKLTVSKTESAQLTKAVKGAAEKAEAERTKVIKRENREREREEERFQTRLSRARAKFYRDTKERELSIEGAYRTKQEQMRFRPGPGAGTGQKALDMERGFREIERARRGPRGVDPGGQTLAEIAAYEASSDRSAKAAARAAQARAKQVAREDDKEAKTAAKEREAAKRQEAMDLRRAMKADQRAERERNRKAAAAERESARAEVRRQRAEAQAAFAEGGEDPRVAEMNAASPGSGDRWAAGQAARGRGRAARQAAVEMRSRRAAFSRGIHGIGALAAGIASGSPLGGMFGGGYGGFLAGSAAGFAGGGALLMSGFGAIGGGAGALGVMGMRDATSNAGRSTQVQRAFGQAAGIAPLEQGRSNLHRWQLAQTAKEMAAYGLTPEEAAGIFNTTARYGGWGGAPMNDQIREAAKLSQTGLGITPDMVGMIELARRRGGLAGAGRIGAGFTSQLGAGAVGLGFQGSEVGDFVGMQAGFMSQARGMNTLFNPTTFGAGVRSLVPSVGQSSASNIAGGLTNALMGVATGGVGGAGDPLTGLMLLQSFGGLQLRQRGGVSAQSILNAQRQIETQGFTAGGLQNLTGRIRGMAGGRGPLAALLGQQVFSRMGVNLGPGRLESLLSGRPANGDVASAITPLADAALQAGALEGGGGMGARAAQISSPEAIAEATTSARNLTAGEMAGPGARAFDHALADFAVKMANAATAIDSLKSSFMGWIAGGQSTQ